MFLLLIFSSLPSFVKQVKAEPGLAIGVREIFCPGGGGGGGVNHLPKKKELKKNEGHIATT